MSKLYCGKKGHFKSEYRKPIKNETNKNESKNDIRSSRKLFSGPAAVAKGANMSITKSGCALTINYQKFGVGTKVGSLYD
jgi:hypothetical protein